MRLRIAQFHCDGPVPSGFPAAGWRSTCCMKRKECLRLHRTSSASLVFCWSQEAGTVHRGSGGLRCESRWKQDGCAKRAGWTLPVYYAHILLSFRTLREVFVLSRSVWKVGVSKQITRYAVTCHLFLICLEGCAQSPAGWRGSASDLAVSFLLHHFSRSVYGMGLKTGMWNHVGWWASFPRESQNACNTFMSIWREYVVIRNIENWTDMGEILHDQGKQNSVHQREYA